MNKYFRVRIKKDQTEIEVESSELEFVEEKLSKFSEHFGSPLEAGQPKPANGKKKESLNEFVMRIRPKSATEYAISIAYYFEKVEGKEEIAVKDIKEGFRLAKFSHSNPSQALYEGKAQGLLMTGSETKLYTLTQSGEKWVEERIQVSSKQKIE